MIETPRLILDKAKPGDWEDMYLNVWSRPESARYMFWSLTTNAAEAPDRMRRTIEFQNTHDSYLIYLRSTGRAIGFAGVTKLSETVYEESGVCLGPEYTGRGLGTEVLRALLDHCRELGAREFRCQVREDNEASNRLIRFLGFRLVSTALTIDSRDGSQCALLQYSLRLDS